MKAKLLIELLNDLDSDTDIKICINTNAQDNQESATVWADIDYLCD